MNTCVLGDQRQMTANMHLLLAHGAEFIDYVQSHYFIPPGRLTESSVELGNKKVKHSRKFHSR